jgi:hypothetical protein
MLFLHPWRIKLQYRSLVLFLKEIEPQVASVVQHGDWLSFPTLESKMLEYEDYSMSILFREDTYIGLTQPRYI